MRVSNRWFRFVIALLAIGLASGAAYRIVQHERQLATVTDASQRVNDAAESSIATVSELKAALHAYVAPGQGQDFWTARSAMLLEKLRGSLRDLEASATSLNLALSDELDLSDRLAAAEQRARGHVRNSQSLLAGEVIFTEARDLLDSMRLQAVRIHDEATQRAATETATIRREQMLLAAAAAGVMALAILGTGASRTLHTGHSTGVHSGSDLSRSGCSSQHASGKRGPARGIHKGCSHTAARAATQGPRGVHRTDAASGNTACGCGCGSARAAA